MKTAKEIEDARAKLRERVLTPGLSAAQTAMLTGMLNALVWAADGPNSSTMERVLSDEPMVAGKSPDRAMEIMEQARSSFLCPKCGQPMAHSRLRGMFCMTCR